MKFEVNRMIGVLNLQNKRDTLSKDLSGGMKRKLCVGIALAAGSKVSCIGPTLYTCIVMKSDLHVVSRKNEIIKFADITTILVAENTDVGLDVEFRQVSKWADINRLTLTTAKTKEIVFRPPIVKYFSYATRY